MWGVCVVVVVSIGSVSLARGLPPPRVEGRITIARGIESEMSLSSADAVFTRGSVFGPVLATDGPCNLHDRAVTEGLSAGTIEITGAASPITLSENRTPRGIRYLHGGVPNPAFTSGATITVEVSGGTDLSAFTTSVTAPPKLAGYVPPGVLDRQAYQLTWTASAGTEIMIMLVAFGQRVTDGVTVLCRVPDSGAFTIPSSTFGLLPPAFDRSILVVARVAETRVTVGEARVAVNVMDAISAGPLPLARAFPNVTLNQTEALPEPSPRRFLSLGFGPGGASSQRSPRGSAYRFQLGQRLGAGLHLVVDVTTLDLDAPTLASEIHNSAGVGLRWMLLEPQPSAVQSVLAGKFVDLCAIYATVIAGVNHRDRVMLSSTADSPSEDSDWSPMASMSLGWLLVRGRDWDLGPELRWQVAHHDGEIQQGWMLLMAVHLK